MELENRPLQSPTMSHDKSLRAFSVDPRQPPRSPLSSSNLRLQLENDYLQRQPRHSPTLKSCLSARSGLVSPTTSATYDRTLLSPGTNYRNMAQTSRNLGSTISPMHSRDLATTIMDRPHERQVSQAYDQLQETTQDRLVEQLKHQLAQLRSQIDVTNDRHQSEMDRLKEEMNGRVVLQGREKDVTIENLTDQIQQLHLKLSYESKKCDEHKQEAETIQRRFQSENTHLQSTISSLQSEIDNLKHQYFNIARNEIQQLEVIHQESRASHDENVIQLRKDHGKEIAELTRIVEGKEKLIQNLEAENKELQYTLSKSTTSNARDMNMLQDSLVQNKQLSEAQDMNIVHLKGSIQKFKTQNRELKKDNKQLDNELRRLKRETQDFRSSVGKMEKLVYGKQVKKVRSPRKLV